MKIQGATQGDRDEGEAAAAPLEIWGGFECTIARVRDDYRDQCAETGHNRRIEDLDAAASLGISRLQYPVLWEIVSPDSPDARNWSLCDERLRRLRDLRLPVIAGLVHHGSGPRYTDLLDPEFPSLLARHAAAVAERYPWIEDFTPVNEPLTTARFSALYGHWYPHARDEASFLRALANQCFAVAAAMTAVRAITPGARLIQTEDFGRIFSTAELADQAAYENERRWLTFDLLLGRVDRAHGWYRSFVRSGVDERLLDSLVDAPCRPDIIGVNHYLTSDRYLDHETEGYPDGHIGGNGRQIYADVAAARAPVDPAELGFGARIVETWRRYELPIAITEVHNGSTREEQIRWLVQAADAAKKTREAGVDLRALTVWALAGGVDWDSLLTQRRNSYEPGVFDVRADPPRETALANVVRALARAERRSHPVARDHGWWGRADRFHKPVDAGRPGPAPTGRPLLVTGRTGTLGRAFERICAQRGLPCRVTSRQELDICRPETARAIIRTSKPWAIINTAGFVRVGEAEREKSRCILENTEGPAILAEVAAREGIPLVTFSSDLVFDGLARRPYVESDPTSPSCVYGASKAEAERRVVAINRRAMVVRASAFFGPWDRYNFVYSVLAALRRGETFSAASDVVVSPTYVPDLVHAVLDLLIDGADGVWHLAGSEILSWREMAQRVAGAAQLDPGLIRELSSGAARNTALRSEKGVVLPSGADAIERCAIALAALEP